MLRSYTAPLLQNDFLTQHTQHKKSPAEIEAINQQALLTQYENTLKWLRSEQAKVNELLTEACQVNKISRHKFFEPTEKTQLTASNVTELTKQADSLREQITQHEQEKSALEAIIKRAVSRLS